MLSLLSTRVLPVPSVNPPLFLEFGPDLRRDFLRSILGPALNLAAAAEFPIGFHPAADDETHRIGGRQPK